MHACSVTWSYSPLCNPMGCSPPVFSVPGIFPERILEWVAISFSRVFSWLRIKPAFLAMEVDSLTLSHLGKLNRVRHFQIMNKRKKRKLRINCKQESCVYLLWTMILPNTGRGEHLILKKQHKGNGITLGLFISRTIILYVEPMNRFG